MQMRVDTKFDSFMFPLHMMMFPLHMKCYVIISRSRRQVSSCMFFIKVIISTSLALAPSFSVCSSFFIKVRASFCPSAQLVSMNIQTRAGNQNPNNASWDDPITKERKDSCQMHLVSAEIKEQAILWQASTIDGFSKAGCCLLKHQHQRGGEGGCPPQSWN